MKGYEGGNDKLYKYFLILKLTWNQQARVHVVVWNQRQGLDSQEGNLWKHVWPRRPDGRWRRLRMWHYPRLRNIRRHSVGLIKLCIFQRHIGIIHWIIKGGVSTCHHNYSTRARTKSKGGVLLVTLHLQYYLAFIDCSPSITMTTWTFHSISSRFFLQWHSLPHHEWLFLFVSHRYYCNVAQIFASQIFCINFILK